MYFYLNWNENINFIFIFLTSLFLCFLTSLFLCFLTLLLLCFLTLTVFVFSLLFRSSYIKHHNWKSYADVGETPAIGSLCLAKFGHDNKWYRGRIEAHRPERVSHSYSSHRGTSPRESKS